MENRRDDMRAMATERASSMRQQALATAAKRKQEYLGARVSKQLREKIILKAEELRIPVSILIRNILTDYIDNQTVDDISQVTSESVVDNKGGFDDVIGWDRLTLNKEMSCEHCSQKLNKGTEVVYGIIPGKNHVIICKKCKTIEGIG
ncbi:MAG: hypothetical protein L3J89_00725 [Gammaproteobacteria bacterium]|nr:hypothetical protein [Gammaproteobacteria bacterium]